jgi:hypothetical protein
MTDGDCFCSHGLHLLPMGFLGWWFLMRSAEHFDKRPSHEKWRWFWLVGFTLPPTDFVSGGPGARYGTCFETIKVYLASVIYVRQWSPHVFRVVELQGPTLWECSRRSCCVYVCALSFCGVVGLSWDVVMILASGFPIPLLSLWSLQWWAYVALREFARWWVPNEF